MLVPCHSARSDVSAHYRPHSKWPPPADTRPRLFKNPVSPTNNLVGCREKPRRHGGDANEAVTLSCWRLHGAAMSLGTFETTHVTRLGRKVAHIGRSLRDTVLALAKKIFLRFLRLRPLLGPSQQVAIRTKSPSTSFVSLTSGDHCETSAKFWLVICLEQSPCWVEKVSFKTLYGVHLKTRKLSDRDTSSPNAEQDICDTYLPNVYPKEPDSLLSRASSSWLQPTHGPRPTIGTALGTPCSRKRRGRQP